MEVEDDYLEGLEGLERMIAEKDTVILENAAALVEKDAALVEKDAAMRTVVEKAIQMLVAGGMSEHDARARLLG